MLPDYLVLDGYEVINSARAVAYGSKFDECGSAGPSCFDCPDMESYLTDGEGYQGVRADPAPWWDEAQPESAGVLGITGLEVTGIAEGAFAVPGGNNQEDQSPTGAMRDVMFRLLVETTDDCAASYAAGWIRRAAGLPACAPVGCAPRSACMLACCPDTDPDTGEFVSDPMRWMFDLTAIGFEEAERGYSSNRVWVIYELTFRTLCPDIYRRAPVAETIEFTPATGDAATIDLPAVYEACVQDVSCTTDPVAPPPDPPDLPSAPADERYPSKPYEAKRTVVSIPDEWMSRTMSTVLVFTLDTQTSARNVLVRTYHNPLGVSCDRLPELNPCRACADALVAYVPPRGELIIDGRTNRRTVTCRGDGITSVARAVVFGAQGGVYVDPEFTCGAAICVEVSVADPVPPTAVVRIELMIKQGAA